MPRWFAILLAAPVLMAQDLLPITGKPLPKLVIPDKLFSAEQFRKFRLRPPVPMARERECSIPLLQVGPQTVGPARVIPVEPVERMPVYLPAPPCE